MAYPVPREACSVCQWVEDEHDPNDWHAFAPWNAHLLCADCYQFALDVAYTSIPNPEEEIDPETVAAVVEAAMAYITGDESDDDIGDGSGADEPVSDAESEVTVALY